VFVAVVTLLTTNPLKAWHYKPSRATPGHRLHIRDELGCLMHDWRVKSGGCLVLFMARLRRIVSKSMISVHESGAYSLYLCTSYGDTQFVNA